MMKKLLLFSLIMSILFCALGCGNSAEKLPDFRYIIHAAGSIDGLSNSNSMDALENAYLQGNRVIEIDFNYTTDGQLACIHDWNYHMTSAIKFREALSLDAFLNCRIYEKYSPMWIGSLAQYMREHPDLYIVTDVKENNIEAARSISENYADLVDRFIVQIYSESEYDAIRELGFDKIIYTIYNLSWEEKIDTAHLVEFARDHELAAITFPYQLCDIEGYVDQMLQAGVPLLIHTVNEYEEQAKYFETGISGIYTDNTVHE